MSEPKFDLDRLLDSPSKTWIQWMNIYSDPGAKYGTYDPDGTYVAPLLTEDEFFKQNPRYANKRGTITYE